MPCPLAARVSLWNKRRIVPQASGLPEYQIKHHQIGETNRYWSSRTNPWKTAATVISIPLPRFKLIGRHVFQHSYNVWRDPRLVDDRSRPVCDSCSSQKKTQEESYHLHDFIFIEEEVVNPQISSLVWRVAQIVQMDTASLKVQLFDRYSDWAKGKKVEFTSEVGISSAPVFDCG